MRKIYFSFVAVGLMLAACGDETPTATPVTPNPDSVAVVTPEPAERFLMGEASYIAISTKNIEESKAFYTKMGFHVVQDTPGEYPWAYMADSTVMIGIFQDSMGYQGLSYYTANYDEKIAGMKAAGAIFDMENEVEGQKMSVFTNPSGEIPIAIVGIAPGDMPQVKGPNLLDVITSPTAMDFATWPNKKCGVFGEYAITTTDLAAEVEFWSKLGYDSLGGGDYGPMSYRIMSDGQQIVGLHNEVDGKKMNSLTFFSPDTKERMAALRKEGIKNMKIDDPMMGDNNFVIETPEGKTFFLFNMPMTPPAPTEAP